LYNNTASTTATLSCAISIHDYNNIIFLHITIENHAVQNKPLLAYAYAYVFFDYSMRFHAIDLMNDDIQMRQYHNNHYALLAIQRSIKNDRQPHCDMGKYPHENLGLLSTFLSTLLHQIRSHTFFIGFYQYSDQLHTYSH